MTLSQFIIEPLPSSPASEPDRALSGRRLYSPLALFAFATLINLPIATVLFGVNLRRRGLLALGNTAIAVSVSAAALVIASALLVDDPADLRLFGFFGGLLLFAVERPAFVVALRQGAVRARWWPPWLLVIGLAVASAVVGAWLQ